MVCLSLEGGYDIFPGGGYLVIYEKDNVTIHHKANATHQSVINVMDAARQVGMTKITFPTNIRDEQ